MLFMHTAVAEAAGSGILPETAPAAPRAGQDVPGQDVEGQDSRGRDAAGTHTAGQYAVAVRSLCEFTARQGDLDLRFTPAPSAQEGIAGHQLVASRRPAHYQTEVSLTGSYGPLRVRGRADGYDPVLQQLEEIKTHRGELSAMPANHRHLHWAQAKMYGWLMCSRLSLDGLNVALVYFDVVSRSETLLVERFSAQELESFFKEQCRRFLGWARCEIAHRDRRDAALRELRFVHPEFRKGQRLLAESVYRAAIRGRCLMAQAPTGIGKTIGTLFPMLKAAPLARIDKIFFLCAKTSGRQLATRGAAPDLRLVGAKPAAAGPRTRRTRKVLRASGQGLPRRLVPARQGVP